jgi:membrane peptidoglycan carboxypeptidase
MLTGLDRTFERSKDCGLVYPSTAIPVVSMGIGTLEVHPIDLLGAYGTIANGGVRMPRKVIDSVVDVNGNRVWPLSDLAQTGIRVTNSGTAYIITDILAGNTDTSVNPYWGKWAITDGDTRRPAAYKTGTTSDNRDVAAYGYLAPPADPAMAALAVGVWMGNSDNSPNDGKLSLDTSAPLWSAILTEISEGMPIDDFVRPSDLETAEVDAFTGLKPGPFTRQTVDELFLPGTIPTQEETSRVGVQIDEASGLLWQEGCAGPQVTRGFFDLSRVESAFPNWQQANANWGARAAKGSGVRGGPEGTRTSYFYNNSFAPFGRTWGAPFAPTELCPIYVPPVIECNPFFEACPPPPVDGLIQVPEVRCLDLESAVATLNGVGFVIGDVESRGNDNDLVVEDTRPRAGEFQPPGTPINIGLRRRDRVDGC